MSTPADFAAEKGSTYKNDEELPKLPVPEIEDTFAGLREALIGDGVTEDRLKVYDEAVKKAMPELEEAQALLNERYEELPNYLGEWWEQFAYLRSRKPTVINTNIFSVWDIDFDKSGNAKPLIPNGIDRAAVAVRETMLIAKLLMDKSLPPEEVAGQSLCMWQYSKMYTMRVPREAMDELIDNPGGEAFESVFMHKGGMFMLQWRDMKNPDAPWLNAPEVKQCIEYGIANMKVPAKDSHVAMLTAGERDTWAAAWEELEKTSERNVENLRRVTSSASIFALDDIPVHTLKEGIERAGFQCGHNRWFDSPTLRIISSNGVMMEHGDHTPMDAIVSASTPLTINAKYTLAYHKAGGLQTEKVRAGFDPAKYVAFMEWDLTPEVKKTVLATAEQHEANCSTAHVDILMYRGFGRHALKAAKVPSDAFMQQVLQLAYSRDRKRIVPIYESGSTRMFQRGRTDTIRSLTQQQREFITAYEDPAVSKDEKKAKLIAAMEAHSEISMKTVQGGGVDRHLMGLGIAQSVLLEKELPEVYTLPEVEHANSYQVFSSQMIGSTFLGGFAHALGDGYGACYYYRPQEIGMVISSNSCEGLTDINRWKAQLTKCITELAVLMGVEFLDKSVLAPAVAGASKL